MKVMFRDEVLITCRTVAVAGVGTGAGAGAGALSQIQWKIAGRGCLHRNVSNRLLKAVYVFTLHS